MDTTCVSNMSACSSPTNVDMETLWHLEFNTLFQNFAQWCHQWTLSPRAFSVLPLGGCFSDKDSAKVRYLCKKCGQGWTSMKGCVSFWYWLDPFSSTGTVLFELMGQKCQKCNDDRFEDPLWYPEEVVKVLHNIYYKVGHAYYGFPPPTFENHRRPGKPRSQHPKDLCQACAVGLCNNRKF